MIYSGPFTRPNWDGMPATLFGGRPLDRGVASSPSTRAGFGPCPGQQKVAFPPIRGSGRIGGGVWCNACNEMIQTA
jgi:hypothetical protein